MIGLWKRARASYAGVRADTPLYSIYDSTLVSWIFSARISPFFTALFVKRGVRPNSITVLMILSGLLGAALFAVDNVVAKLVGYVFIQLWFVMDCSDGEVARITKDFSRYGTEMDYLAHILTHPAFQISFLVSASQLYVQSGVEPLSIVVIFAAIAVVEIMIRALLGLQLLCKYKDSDGTQGAAPYKKPRLYNLAISAIYVYPNVALFFPIVYLFDLFFGSMLGYYYAILVLCVSAPMMVRLASSLVSQMGKYPSPAPKSL